MDVHWPGRRCRLHRWGRDFARAVPARLPDRLHVLDRPEPRLPGAVDAPVSVRRPVGTGDSPGPGSRQQVPAADVCVVSAHPDRAREALRVDDRSCAHRPQFLVSEHPGMDRTLGCLFRDLDLADAHPDPPWRHARRAWPTASLPGTERRGSGALRPDRVLRVGRLGHVARSALGARPSTV